MKGPLLKSDPNNPSQKPKTPEMQAKVRKRVAGEDNEDANQLDDDTRPRPSKRSKAELDSLLEAKSSHADLIDQYETQQSEEYFNKLERKEQMETKMLDTFEIKTTAVSCLKVTFNESHDFYIVAYKKFFTSSNNLKFKYFCFPTYIESYRLQCKYTALSASELCRREGHPLRSIKAVKRFFQCKDCKNRTISLDRLPKRPCNQCGSSNWEKTAMAKVSFDCSACIFRFIRNYFLSNRSARVLSFLTKNYFFAARKRSTSIASYTCNYADTCPQRIFKYHSNNGNPLLWLFFSSTAQTGGRRRFFR